MYWTRTSAEERRQRREEILESLREQHQGAASGPEAHPTTAFNLPDWHGEPAMSAAALIGNAPEWATV